MGATSPYDDVCATICATAGVERWPAAAATTGGKGLAVPAGDG